MKRDHQKIAAEVLRAGGRWVTIPEAAKLAGLNSDRRVRAWIRGGTVIARPVDRRKKAVLVGPDNQVVRLDAHGKLVQTWTTAPKPDEDLERRRWQELESKAQQLPTIEQYNESWYFPITGAEIDELEYLRKKFGTPDSEIRCRPGGEAKNETRVNRYAIRILPTTLILP
jgi:hypothetical protein